MIHPNFSPLETHCHTIDYSDWTMTTDTLIEIAKSRSMDLLYITDHDYWTPLKNIMKIQDAWMHTEHSTEASVRFSLDPNDSSVFKRIHIPSYMHSPSNKSYEILKNTRTQKEKLKKWQIKKLSSLWFEISYKEIFQYLESIWRSTTSCTKYDMASYLYLWDKDPSEVLKDITGTRNFSKEGFSNIFFLNECLKEWWKFYEIFWHSIDEYEPTLSEWSESMWSTSDMRMLRSIAHPHFTWKNEWFDGFLKDLPLLIEQWINAIEIPSLADKKWTWNLISTANANNLYKIPGSDFHWDNSKKHWEFWVQNPLLSIEDLQRMTNEQIARMNI